MAMVVNTRPVAGTRATTTIGRIAPATKLEAETTDACTGRANADGSIPSSSLA